MDECVSFGLHLFDLPSGRLWKGAREIRLTPKASAVLRVLVTQSGKLVTKDELFATVWTGTAVGDDALTSTIQELRRALADNAKQPRVIETRHRRGYRFVAPLSEQAGETAAEPRLPAADASAIAVLPFADMSRSRDQDYFCEGLAEELINALTHVAGLRVAARTPRRSGSRHRADIRAAGDRLASARCSKAACVRRTIGCASPSS